MQGLVQIEQNSYYDFDTKEFFFQIHVHLHMKCTPSSTIIIPGSVWSMKRICNMHHLAL